MSTSCEETEVMDSGDEVNVTDLENAVPLQKCDVGVQWPDATDHNYASNKSTKDSATQTDPAPSMPAYDLDDKDSEFFTDKNIDSFWQLLYTLMAFLPQLKMTKLAVHEKRLLVLMRLHLSLMFTDLNGLE